MKKAIGSPCRSVFKAEICKKNCMLRHSIRTGEPVINCKISITDAKGMQMPVSISTAIIKDDNGQVIGGVETFRDLTAEKAIRAELTKQYTFRNIVTKNPKMQSLLRLLETVAETEVTVLLEGESGNMPFPLQSKLLRVIQDRIYEPLGGVRSEMADLRIIVATNQSLENLVESGLFRMDLYYRIKVFRMVLPPLRERREDIPLLAEHFIKKFSAINGKNIDGINPDAILRLMEHDWPGNVRELENVIEYATVVCKTNRIIAENLPDDLTPEKTARTIPITSMPCRAQQTMKEKSTYRSFI